MAPVPSASILSGTSEPRFHRGTAITFPPAWRVDFPAAHSMDTRWFAVDEDGHVGLFETEENGALPHRAANLGGPGEPNFDVLLYDAFCVACAVASRSHTGRDGWRGDLSKAHHPTRALVVVDGAPTDVGLDVAAFDVMCARDPWVGLSRNPLPPSELQRLAGLPQVREVVEEVTLREGGAGDSENQRPFQFAHDDEEEPGQYLRTDVPDPPVHVDSLPERLREAVSRLRLPVRFAATEALHLADYLSDSDASIWSDCTLRGLPTQPGPVDAPLERSSTRDAKAAMVRLAIFVAVAIALFGLFTLVVRWWVRS